MIRKVFEIGADSVMVPHICTRDDAVKAVKAAKFPPNGIRSAASGLRCARYRVHDWPSFVKWSNENTMVSILIEDVNALKNLDDILTVKGIDAVCFGALDFSLSAGLMGLREHPKVKDAFNQILDKCKAKDIPVIFTPAKVESNEIKSLIDKGVRILVLTNEIKAFLSECNEIMDILKGCEESLDS